MLMMEWDWFQRQTPLMTIRMPTFSSLFVTRLYHARLSGMNHDDLENACFSIAEDDEAGQEWCEREGFPGYTSYASLDDLPYRFPIFADLVKTLDAHVAAFAADLAFDLGDKKLVLDSLWINILPEGGIHTGHIHPHSVISGTTYVAMPADTSAIKFEDPRLAMMMAALVSGIGFLVFVYGVGYFDENAEGGSRFSTTLLGFSASMLGLVLADSIWTVLVGWF